MIFVTAGMTPYPFDRLVNASDQMASLIKEPVVIQKGTSKVKEHAAKHINFADSSNMEKFLSSARIIITHAAAGSILSARNFQKPIIVVPRLARYGEHFDDHQFELAQALAETGRVIMVKEISAESLLDAINKAEQLKHHENKSMRLVEFMPYLLNNIERKRTTSRWGIWWSKGRFKKSS